MTLIYEFRSHLRFFSSPRLNLTKLTVFLNFEPGGVLLGKSDWPKSLNFLYYSSLRSGFPKSRMIGRLFLNLGHPSLPWSNYCRNVFTPSLTFSSQGTEQLNRVLKWLASSVSYMTSRNFHLTLSVFMAGQNYLRIIDNHAVIPPPMPLPIAAADAHQDDEHSE